MSYNLSTESSKKLEGFAMRLNQEEQPELAQDIALFLQNNSDGLGLSTEAIDANVQGLRDGQWDGLANLMLSGRIFSVENKALIIAPYHVRRPGNKQKLSLLLCEKLNISEFPFNAKRMNPYQEVDFKPITPIRILYSGGNISGDKGEMFIVPTAWKTMPQAANASPMLDVVGSQTRLKEMATNSFMKGLYNDKAANDLMAFRDNTSDIVLARFWEYSLHEYGHAEGLFVQRMPGIRGNMQQAALEEWRSDGVMAGLVDSHVQGGDISKEQGRKILMSNFLTRFGMDVVRNKNKVDHDVLASYYIFDTLKKTGMIDLKDNKLCLLGDTLEYDYWRKLYAGMAENGAAVTKQVRESKGTIDVIPCNEKISLEEFIHLIEGAVNCASVHTNSAVANKLENK